MYSTAVLSLGKQFSGKTVLMYYLLIYYENSNPAHLSLSLKSNLIICALDQKLSWQLNTMKSFQAFHHANME